MVDATEWACGLCAIALKTTEPVEQWICIKLCVKLEHSSVETIEMIQKGTAMGNVIGSFNTTMHLLIHHTYCRVFAETSNHPGDSDPLRPRFGALQLLDFLKTKITFEREEIQENTMRQRLGELCKVPRCLLWRWLRHHCPMYNVSCIFFNKCLYFPFYMTGYIWDRPHITLKSLALFTF